MTNRRFNYEYIISPVAALILFSSLLSGAPTLKPMVMGKRGVVAAGHPLVAEAGLRILEKGGNAVDAGVATVFAAAVVELGSFGAGGECPILIRLRGQQVVAINGAGIAPALATVEYYHNLRPDDPRLVDTVTPNDRKGIIPSYGPLSALVPSAVDSLILALENYGTLSFAEIIQPAIELAEGFPLSGGLEKHLVSSQKTFENWPTSRQIYTPRGRLPREGELFVQADLAKTLGRLAEAEKQSQGQGRTKGIEAARDYFYRGPVAKHISDFCEQAGCLLRDGDFAAYHAEIVAPFSTHYRGVDVYKAGFWTQGPVLLQNLNLLEGFDLKSMGHNSAEYIHTVVEAMKLSYADRDAYYGDPEFSEIPVGLISKEYANTRRSLISPQNASAEHIPGDPVSMQARAPAEFVKKRYSQRNGDHQDTTCVNVIDKDGNMFSATPSGAWIPAVIAGDTGIPLTQRAQSFVLTPGHPNQLAPHKHPRITLTPSLALREGKPWLAFSTPGGDSQDQTLLQVFLNIAEFGMNPQQAVEAPRFNSEAIYSSFDAHPDHPSVLDLEGRFPNEVRAWLQQRGHHLKIQGDWDNPTAATVVEFDAETSVIRAGADVRGYRYALAW